MPDKGEASLAGPGEDPLAARAGDKLRIAMSPVGVRLLQQIFSIVRTFHRPVTLSGTTSADAI
jgi:hypothetical protein